MARRIAIALLTLTAMSPFATLTAQEPEAASVEATRQETWTLGGQQWDFGEVTSVFQPIKGTLNADGTVAVWTLEIVKELSPGEAGTQNNVEGTPFKPVFLDEEKIAVLGDARIRITAITGKLGDRIRMSVQLPKAELLGKVKLVRVERRTRIGF